MVGLQPIKHMPLEVVKALVDEAHRQGKLALAHTGTPKGWQEAIDAGVDLIMHYDPTEEYQQMARAGMSFRQILASLTTTAAERLGSPGQSAKLGPGMEADIVLLEADPAQDVTAFSRVRYTIRGGRIIYQSKSLLSGKRSNVVLAQL